MISKQLAMADLPALPNQITSLDGQTVATCGPVWRLRSAADGGKIMVFNWAGVEPKTVGQPPVYSLRARRLMQLYIADCLTRRQATTAYVYYATFLWLGRWFVAQPDWYLKVCQPGGFEWSRLDEALARAILDWGIEETASNGDYFRHLRIFYHWGMALQYPDFNLETARILKSIKATMHPVGHHVRFRHPAKGPFSPAERTLIVEAVRTAKGKETDRALVMLCLELGLHPKAAARLMNQDLRRFETSQGLFYQLAVPRVKKRSVTRETKRRPISQRLGQLLNQLQQGAATDHLLHWLNPDQPEGDLATALQRWAKEVALISPRTDARLHLTARRFRYTLATHLAEEGASKYHIAAILDHTDLNYVGVYTETTSTIAVQVAEATDALLTPVVQRFLGQLVEADAADPNEIILTPTPHLSAPGLELAGIGVCGRSLSGAEACSLFPPLSCYLCPSFAAWRTGPHQDVLRSIETYLSSHEARLDARIQAQLEEVRQAIAELLLRVHPTQEGQNDHHADTQS
jgi:integrase